MVYILIQIDNITFIPVIKSVTSANMPGLSGQCSNSLAVFIILKCFLSFFKLQHSRFESAKITIYCKTTNFSSKKFKTSSEMFRFLQERFSYQE